MSDLTMDLRTFGMYLRIYRRTHKMAEGDEANMAAVLGVFRERKYTNLLIMKDAQGQLPPMGWVEECLRVGVRDGRLYDISMPDRWLVKWRSVQPEQQGQERLALDGPGNLPPTPPAAAQYEEQAAPPSGPGSAPAAAPTAQVARDFTPPPLPPRPESL